MNDICRTPTCTTQVHGEEWCHLHGGHGYQPAEEVFAELDLDPHPRSEWTASDYAVEVVCWTVGCKSWLGRFRGWGYRFVCSPLCLWFLSRDERRESRA